ncbi:MAG: histidine kinase dimerization/phospho-acceptor domain-containing protein, partial [Hyphomicrobiales bacterium]
MEQAPPGKLESPQPMQADTVAPARAGASGVLRTVIGRLSGRRWLVLTSILVVLGLVAAFGLSWQGAGAAVAMLIAALGLVPGGEGTAGSALLVSRGRDGEQSRDLAALIDAIPDPAMLLTRNGNVYAANAKAREQYANLRRGTHISAAMRQPEVLDALRRASKSSDPQTVTFTQRVPVESRIAATLSTLHPRRDGGPGAPSLLITMRDLTEQERLNQMRTEFIANASHELRTPLASLLGFVETLQGSARDDPAARDR